MALGCCNGWLSSLQTGGSTTRSGKQSLASPTATNGPVAINEYGPEYVNLVAHSATRPAAPSKTPTTTIQVAREKSRSRVAPQEKHANSKYFV